jgi:hypothetical protein
MGVVKRLLFCFGSAIPKQVQLTDSHAPEPHNLNRPSGLVQRVAPHSRHPVFLRSIPRQAQQTQAGAQTMVIPTRPIPRGGHQNYNQTTTGRWKRKENLPHLQGLVQRGELGLQAHVVAAGRGPLIAQRGHLPRQHALVRLHLPHVRHQPLVLILQRIYLHAHTPPLVTEQHRLPICLRLPSAILPAGTFLLLSWSISKLQHPYGGALGGWGIYPKQQDMLPAVEVGAPP